MVTFAQAVNQSIDASYTNNGMVTNADSSNPCVDLFFAIGSSRGKDQSAAFERAYTADPSVALRMLFWARDIRGGAGERDTFRKLMQHMEKTDPNVLGKVLHLVPEYGRWDDLLIFNTPLIKLQSYSIINRALRTGNGLAAKWMPRKGIVAKELRSYMNETPKGYRKLLVNLTKVVESQMCANQWSDIKYSQVPSVAAARYQKAFDKHDPQGYAAYKDDLKSGTTKINAAAVYPYDVIKSINHGDKEVALAQWEALPNFLGEDFILPMVDVSGSMTCQAGDNKNLTCMDVAVSLGLYLADKQSGPFKDAFLTFSANSKIQMLSGNLLEKMHRMHNSEWGMNTSIESAFNEILRVAKNANVSADQMPKYLLILSDMEFDSATHGANINAMDMVTDMYYHAGYQLPKIVFWNLNARRGATGNVPVSFRKDGTAMVSGFSPAILKNILAAKSFTPADIMMDTLNDERYSPIEAVLRSSHLINLR